MADRFRDELSTLYESLTLFYFSYFWSLIDNKALPTIPTDLQSWLL